MKKIIVPLFVLGVFGFCSLSKAQESIPDDSGYVQITLPCPYNPEKIVERCYWVLWHSTCDPAVQELC